MADPIHRDKPIVIDETAGKKAYCGCGLSATLPYCDGAHKRENTGISPIVVEIEEDRKVAICQCHRSSNGAYCDGTHSKG